MQTHLWLLSQRDIAKRGLLAAAAMLMTLMLMGCTARILYVHGNPAILDERAVSQIQVGESMEGDVITAVAKPGSITIEDQTGTTQGYHYACVVSECRWRYVFSRRTSITNHIDTHIYRLDLVLDELGTVRKKTYLRPEAFDEKKGWVDAAIDQQVSGTAKILGLILFGSSQRFSRGFSR